MTISSELTINGSFRGELFHNQSEPETKSQLKLEGGLYSPEKLFTLTADYFSLRWEISIHFHSQEYPKKKD